MKYIRNLIIIVVIGLILGSCASTEVRAVRQGDLQKLEKFLSKGGDPNDVDKDGNGLIHIAVEYGQADSLLTLLNAGANADLLNRAGNTALILAVSKNAMNMVDILFSYGADASITGSGGRTTLMTSAVTGSIPLMKRILSQGVDLEAVDNSGQSALFYSVSSNNPEALLFFLDSGADAGHRDNKDRTVLHLLTNNGQRAMARMLIQAGADPSGIQSLTGESPLHIASGSGSWELVEEYLTDHRVKQQINLLSMQLGAPLFYALNPGLSSEAAVKTMKMLLDAGANPNLASVQGILPIVQGVKKLDAPRVELLVNSGSKVKFLLEERKTLLHLAVTRNMPDLVEILVQAGIDPDLIDSDGNTALLMAVVSSYTDTAEILLASGADPDIINNEGKTILYIALERDADRKKGISEESSLLLRYRASLPPGKNILSQLLLRTLNSGNADVAEILLRDGANPNERVQDGMTILMLSSSRSFSELSEILIRKGARLNMWDKNGNTAMHYASGAGSVKDVELLLRFGEKPDPMNYESIRPIEMAPANDQGNRIIEILLAAGAQALPQKVEPEVVVQVDEDSDTVSEETVVEVEESDIVVDESETDTQENDDSTDKDKVTESPVLEDSPEDVNVIQAEEIKEEQEKNVEWGRAKILSIGETEPQKVSGDRISFENFSALVPKSYPRNLYSKSNNREVTLYILNETETNAEIYFVNTVGIIEAVQVLSPWESTSIDTREGNIYPVYTQDSKYFGEIKTTGREEQYFRLTESD